MSHEFGSIAEPGTRSLWEDWDDIGDEPSHPGLQWKEELQIPEAINTLCIFEGGFLTDTIEKSTLRNVQPVNSIPKASLHLYKSSSVGTYICTVKDYDLVQSTEIVELLRPYIMVSKCIVVSLMRPLHDFQTDRPINSSCIARRVSTSKCSVSNTPVRIPADVWSFDKLEQPNIITGVTAGVLSVCEHLNLWATAIVCYTSPTDGRIPELEALMNQLNLPTGDHVPTNTVFTSNLYI